MKNLIRNLSLLSVLLFILVVQAKAQHLAGVYDDTLIPPLQDNKQTLLEVLDRLEGKYAIIFDYDPQLINKKMVEQELLDKLEQSKNVEEMLKDLLKPLDLHYEKYSNNSFLIYSTLKPLQQIPEKTSDPSVRSPGNIELMERLGSSMHQIRYVQQNISGKVTDGESGEPLPGVNILAKGTTVGTVSDADGNYRLTVSDEVRTLVFSSIGYISEEVAINSQTNIDLALMPDIQSLSEVVVVGYGTQKKSDLTGSVAQVKSEQINAFPTANMLQSLSGRAPGVQVLQTTGAPGAGTSVRIRGTSSIQGGNEPLYVVDGFPFSGNPTNLNNSDIESVEILKDASATAIYGSRGANGVVIITTKKGKAGRTNVNFETSYSVQKLRRKLDLMNGQQYALLANMQAENDGIDPYFTQEEINNFGEGYDWQDLVFQNAPMKTSSLSISGGNEKTQFSVGGSFFGQEGIIQGSDYNRYSLRANINHKINEKLSVNVSSTSSYLKTERKDSDGGHRGTSLIGAAIAAAPISRPYNEDGSYTVLANEYPFVAPDIINPLNFIHEQFTETKANVVLTNAAFVYQPLPAITIKISGGIENRDDRTDAYTTRDFFNSNGSASISTSQFRSLLSENTISYNKTIDERHSFSAVAGFTYQDFDSTSLGGSGVGFLSDAFETHDLSAAENPNIPSSSYSKSVLLSYLGRVNYTLLDRYLFTFSFRSDGSSRYSEGNKWGYFPSGAVAWRISDEGFMQNNGLFSDMKLRASWGLTGSQAISPYATLNLLSSGNTVFDDQLYNTFSPGTRLPGDLRWETTEQIDIGLDFGLMENRIFITADYYIKNTRDLLNTVRLPNSMGFTSTIQNVGQVQNKGFELGIDSRITTGEFKWDLYANLSLNRNKVIKLQGGEDILGGYVGVLVVQDNVTILREGRPIGQFWGYVEDGYDEEGQISLEDVDGDGAITAEDKTYIGDPNPSFIYGLNSSMSYKNFELNLFLQGSQGNDIFNASAIPVTLDYGQGLNMPREVFTNHWTPDNPNAKYPIISRNTSAVVSDRWIEDGSYMRLRNIELAYNLPFESLGIDWIRNAKLYVSGQNLLTITNYSWWDPEVNSKGTGTSQGIDHFTYPIPKTFTVGLRAGF
ncbi:SusC/RagA family TonB-linked outer membrane protein [Catalinimonas niigatensis]|uniref:SusC/RagA family TonB-linked outer membrane protein n=1 Tax=Catalinimonas niigatensis TaxID=1397264 RepID=UPI002666D052|nr:TonB-dependent receptor [Catalinimonas niigatensis]WPP48019.1 TonB-dependent receptor [Catalinimonas niigatensis]